MSALAKLMIQIGIDSSDMDGSLKKVGDKLRGIGSMMTATVTVPVVTAFGFMIKGASDLAEATSAATTVFGNESQKIIDASKNAATQVGLSQQEYLSAATQLGVMAQAAGLTGEAVSDFSQETLAAAADLSSFYNVPITEVLAAWQSGLMGETEPMRRFGVMLNETELQAYAMSAGLWDGVGAMTEQEKVAARQSYQLSHLGAATGDFARTQDGLANQLRIVSAQAKDVSAQFGTLLLPYMLKIVEVAREMVTWVQGLSDKQQKWILITMALAAAMGPLLIALSMMLPALALMTGPIGLIVLGLVALGIAYRENLLGFGDAVNAVSKELVKLGKAWRASGFKGMLNVMKADLRNVDWGNVMKDAGKLLIRGFIGSIKLHWELVKLFVRSQRALILSYLPNVAVWLVRTGIDLIKGLLTGLKEKWPDIRTWVRELPQKIFDYLSIAGVKLLTRGRQFLRGLQDGILEKWPDVYSFFVNLPTNVYNAIKGASSALVQTGYDLATGVITGLNNRWNDVTGFAQSLANAVWEILKQPFNWLDDKMPGMPGVPDINPFGGMSFGGSSAPAGNNVTININGYNRDPRELAAEISRLFAHDIGLTIGVPA